MSIESCVDLTAIAGNFDLDLAWTPAPGEYTGLGPFDHNAPAAAEATSIFTALQEQLGLRLEATTRSGRRHRRRSGGAALGGLRGGAMQLKLDFRRC